MSIQHCIHSNTVNVDNNIVSWVRFTCISDVYDVFLLSHTRFTPGFFCLKTLLGLITSASEPASYTLESVC